MSRSTSAATPRHRTRRKQFTSYQPQCCSNYLQWIRSTVKYVSRANFARTKNRHTGWSKRSSSMNSTWRTSEGWWRTWKPTFASKWSPYSWENCARLCRPAAMRTPVQLNLVVSTSRTRSTSIAPASNSSNKRTVWYLSD